MKPSILFLLSFFSLKILAMPEFFFNLASLGLIKLKCDSGVNERKGVSWSKPKGPLRVAVCRALLVLCSRSWLRRALSPSFPSVGIVGQMSSLL